MEYIKKEINKPKDKDKVMEIYMEIV